jgi:hypothetical protein
VVIHPPVTPGHGGGKMPTPPKPVDPNHMINPARNGDGRAIQPPTSRNGQPITQKPLVNKNGRLIPPGSKNIGIINGKGMIGNINGIQGHWNDGDHGYGWYNWNGQLVGHHYDEFGYHWWGFYIGDAYFWTRYYNNMYWWWDPYWHRWCWQNGSSWWWQDVNGVMYIVIDGNYYQYQDDNGTVVVVPDPTQPVDVPPGPVDPSQPASYYSADGTRFVTIDPTDGSAYLYDATVADPSDPRAQGRLLATGVSSVQFGYASDGSQSLQQIDLTFSDGITTAVADPNGDRLITLPGDGTAVLTNLDDATVAPVTLSQEASSVSLIDQAGQDASGENGQVLRQIVVAQQDGTTATFDQDGNAAGNSLQLRRAALREPAAQVRTMQQHVRGSEALKALQGGSFSWQ